MAALVAAISGVIFGAGVAVTIVKRKWWIASGVAAFGTANMLNTVTAGHGSPSEGNAVWVTSLVLLGYALIAVIAAQATRARRRSPKQSSQRVTN
jgi:hypothetical protein